jgi:hypothetical protein
MRPGRAPVVPRAPKVDSGAYPVEADPPAPVGARVRGDRMRRLRRGGGWSVAGLVWALLCWVVWAAANRSKGLYVAPLVFVSTLAVAAFVFVVLRLVGRLVIEGWMHRLRRSAVGAHLGTFAFLIAVGVTYLQQTSWIQSAYHYLKGL